VPELWYSRQILGVEQALANGFDGSGVIVGIEDTGVDFAHPDLHGTFARVSDPESPYYGYPLVYDDSSASSYVTRGGDPRGTNYADASAVFTTTAPLGDESTAVLSLPATKVVTDEGGRHTYPAVVTRTVKFKNTSQSRLIHYGIHPDNRLNRTEVITEQESVVIGAPFIVTDEARDGVYDTVYVDLGTQTANGAYVATYDFTQSVPARLGPDRDPTVYSDITGDGIADLSGGIVYFIADGEHHVPILDWLWDAYGEEDPENRIEPPAPGTVVAFYGDFDGNSHGTGVATQIVGQGVIDSAHGVGINVPPGTGATDAGAVVGGVTPGMAPGAKVFASRALGVPNQWLAMTRGYDGEPNTGDDAQVINNSWSSTSIQPSIHNFYDVVATALNAVDESPHTLFIVSAGNGGQGYGTIGSPASSSTVLAVGADTQLGTYDIQEIISDSLQIRTGEPASYSSRGPDLMNRAGVAVMAVGSGASGGRPLNLTADRSGRRNGNHAWIQFGGTSQAAPQTTAVAALVYQAYASTASTAGANDGAMGTHDSWPTYDVAQDLLQFGADDMDLEAALQGAGRVNADQSTAIAAGLYGVSTEGEWVVAQEFEDFPATAFAGTTYTRTAALRNGSDRPVTVTMSSDRLTAIGSQYIEIPTTLAEESPYQYKRLDYLVTPDRLEIPAGTDLMQVHMAQEFDRFCTEDPSGPHTGCGRRGTSAYYLRALSWIDWNENGRVWDDADGNGVVNDGELDLPITPTFAAAPDPRTSAELAVVGESNLSANSGDLRIRQPLERGGEGLHLGLIHRARSESVPTDTIRLHITYYQHQPWPWLTLATNQVVVPPGGSAEYAAQISLPSDAPTGYYEGAIRVASDPGGNNQAGVRLLNALPGSGAVDIYSDGRLLAQGLAFSQMTDAPYAELAPGWHQVAVAPTGAPEHKAFIRRSLKVRSGTEYTFAAVADTVSGTLQAIVDGNLSGPSDARRLRFINLSPDAAKVDVYANNVLLWSGVGYRRVTSYAELPAQTLMFSIVSSGTSEPVATVGPVEVPLLGASIFLVGEVWDDSVRALFDRSPARTHFPLHVSTIPVVVNVAARSDLSSPLTMGGMPTSGTLHDNGRVFGLTDWRGNGTARQGDWRSFFVDVPEESELGVGSMFLMRSEWPSVPTDVDLLVYGPQDRELDGSSGELREVVRSGRYMFPVDPETSGPYDIGLKAQTLNTSHAADGRGGTAYSFHTITGGPVEWLAGPLQSGIQVFSHHNVLYDGASASGAPFTTTVGSVAVSPPRVHEWSKEMTGTFEVRITPSMDLDGLEWLAYGLQPMEVISDGVGQASPPGNLNDPNGNKVYTMTVASSGLIDVLLEPNTDDPSYDLDMYLQLEDEEGKFNEVARSAGPTAAEHIRVALPEDGTYHVVVHGFAVPEGATYTLTLFDASGTDLNVSSDADGPVPGGSTVTLSVTFGLDYEEGTQYGVLYLGPSGVPSVFSIPVAVTRGEINLWLPAAMRGAELE
jgi:hypothetical protein